MPRLVFRLITIPAWGVCCRLRVFLLLAVVAPACMILCPDGQSRPTRTIAGALPLDDVTKTASKGLRDGAKALFNTPKGVAFSPDGAGLAVADANNNGIRLVSVDLGNVSTLAGIRIGNGGGRPGSADGQAASFNGPCGVRFSPSGELLAVADEQNSRIRLLQDPFSRSPAGATTRTLAGGTVGTADGIGSKAQFTRPSDVAFSPGGQVLVVADTGSNRIRMIDIATGRTITLAGDEDESGLADGVATEVRFKKPCGIAYSPDGSLVAVADSGNHAVRLIRIPASLMSENTTVISTALTDIIVYTLAGNGSVGFNDGLSASFSDPRGLSFSPDGTLLAVADYGNNAIRIINITSGSTSTIAGRPPFSSQMVVNEFGDGAGPTFYQPTGVSFSPNGQQIAVGDSGNHAIRLIHLTCMHCNVGSFKDARSADCVPCPVGQFNDVEGSSSCSDCPGGKFNDLVGSLTCLDCPAGKFSATTTKCEICPHDTLSNSGSANITDCFCTAGFTGPYGEKCSTCLKGFYKNTNGSQECLACEMGKASNISGASTCTDCAPGSYSDTISARTCSSCTAGTYSSQSASNCSDCPDDTYSAIGSGYCTCNFGYTGPNLGPCSACAPGTFKSVNGSAECQLCEKGKFSDKNASSTCTVCSVFTTTSALGSIRISDCVCDVGYSDADTLVSGFPTGAQRNETVSKVANPHVNLGTWLGAVALSPLFDIISSRGFQEPEDLLYFLLDVDAFDSFVDDSDMKAGQARVLWQSLVNLQQSIDNSTNVNQTNSNTTGKSGNDTSIVITSPTPTCRSCPAGTFKSDIGSASCVQCPADSYSGKASERCSSCPRFAQAPAGSTEIVACTCKRGYRGPPGGTCNLPDCAQGQYNQNFSSPDPTALNCVLCAENSWSKPGRLGAESCTCNAGFSGKDGGPCHACEPGKYKPSNGSAACSTCRANSYAESESAAMRCIDCPDNSYSFEGSAGAMSCSCNPGYSGPLCVIFRPQDMFNTGSCPADNSFRIFEVEMNMNLEALNTADLNEMTAKCAKEIANYYGANSPDSSGSNRRARMTSTSNRRTTYPVTLKQNVKGDQQKFVDGAAGQADALTNFLKLRGLKGARVLGISAKCGAGFTVFGINSTCQPCKVGTYKYLPDNSKCVACPVPSTTEGEGAMDISACSKWAGQVLTKKIAKDTGYILSAIVGSVVGVNTVSAVVSVLSSLISAPTLSASGKDFGSGDISSIDGSGLLPLSGMPSVGWGGGGATVALLTQVQFLQVMARIGGSNGPASMAFFADSIGWFNFEFEHASFFGGTRNAHVMRYSPIDNNRLAEADSTSMCSFEALIPTLDKLIWCVIVLAAVALIRLNLAIAITNCFKKELPSSMEFPSWEGPVVLVEYVAICSSAFLAISTACDKWMAVGYVILVFWPIGFFFLSAFLLFSQASSEHITYESYGDQSQSFKTPPTSSEMWKSLDKSKGILPNSMRIFHWLQAVTVRGWWLRVQYRPVRFLIGDYIGCARYFGIWLIVKKILLLAATTVLDGRGNAIMCIVVQTFDMFFVIWYRPFVSKMVCFSECIAAVTNWLAFLNLGLLLWPGSIIPQLGEETVFGVALFGTGIAAIVASAEALVAAFMLIVCTFSCCSAYVACARAKPQPRSAETSTTQEREGPVFLTSIACDWVEPEVVGPQLMDVSHDDPAKMAAYYQQLADYHHMISEMKSSPNGKSHGKSESSPSMLSPAAVSVSTAPLTYYNGTNQLDAGSRNLPAFSDPLRSMSNSPASFPKTSPGTTFSRRTVPSDLRDEYVNDDEDIISGPNDMDAAGRTKIMELHSKGKSPLQIKNNYLLTDYGLSEDAVLAIIREETEREQKERRRKEQELLEREREPQQGPVTSAPFLRSQRIAPQMPRSFNSFGPSISPAPSPTTSSSSKVRSLPSMSSAPNQDASPASISVPRLGSRSPRRLADRDSPQPVILSSPNGRDQLREDMARRAEMFRQGSPGKRKNEDDSIPRPVIFSLPTAGSRPGAVGRSPASGAVTGAGSSPAFGADRSPSALPTAPGVGSDMRRGFGSRGYTAPEAGGGGGLLARPVSSMPTPPNYYAPAPPTRPGPSLNTANGGSGSHSADGWDDVGFG